MKFNPCVTKGAKTIYPEAKCVTRVSHSLLPNLGERTVLVTDHCITLNLHLLSKTLQHRDPIWDIHGAGGIA